MRKHKDLTGEIFGRLLVIEEAGFKQYSLPKQIVRYWLCECSCGKTTRVSAGSLRSGQTRSCGCIRKEQAARNRPTPRNNKGLSKTNEYAMWSAAKERATKFGREFTIEVADVVIPEVCPVLGIPLFKGKGKQSGNSPSLDRIDSTLGYTKDNICVISHRANAYKQDATVEILQALLSYMTKETKTYE